jgi:hypothetical protein
MKRVGKARLKPLSRDGRTLRHAFAGGELPAHLVSHMRDARDSLALSSAKNETADEHR